MKPSPSSAACSHRGFTLVEVVVALVVLGLTAGLVASSLRTPSAPSRGELDRVVATARSSAMRRAQALELRVEADGQWALRPDLGGDSTAILSGRIPSSFTALHLRIDALGTCVPRTAVAWDATQCREVAGR